MYSTTGVTPFWCYPACFENNLCGSMFHLRLKSKIKWCNFILLFQRRINSFDAEIIPHISRSLWRKRQCYIFGKGGILRHQRKYINRLEIMKKGVSRYVTFTNKVSFQTVLPKSSPTYRRQVINQRHKTPIVYCTLAPFWTFHPMQNRIYRILALNAHTVMPYTTPDNKVHGAHMGPTRRRQDPGGPRVGPMKLAIWDSLIWWQSDGFKYTVCWCCFVRPMFSPFMLSRCNRV